jgi:acyl carrier protein
MSDVEERVKKVIGLNLGVRPEEVERDHHLVKDLGADSLDEIELVMALEEEFDIWAHDEDVEGLLIVKDIVKYIEDVSKERSDSAQKLLDGLGALGIKSFQESLTTTGPVHVDSKLLEGVCLNPGNLDLSPDTEQPKVLYTEKELLEGLNPDTAHTDEAFGISTEWTDKHYDHDYKITEEDIKRGYIRVDPYFVAMMWRLGQKDDTGILFHNLKNISRFGEKNSIEREIKAFEAQINRLKELRSDK